MGYNNGGPVYPLIGAPGGYKSIKVLATGGTAKDSGVLVLTLDGVVTQKIKNPAGEYVFETSSKPFALAFGVTGVAGAESPTFKITLIP